MTKHNSIKYNAHARTSSYSVYNLREDMDDNCRTQERIKRREIVDLFAPEFAIERSKVSLGYSESLRDNYQTAGRIKEKEGRLADLFAPEFETKI